MFYRIGRTFDTFIYNATNIYIYVEYSMMYRYHIPLFGWFVNVQQIARGLVLRKVHRIPLYVTVYLLMFS